MSLYFSQVYDSFSTAMHPPLNIAVLSFLCFVFRYLPQPICSGKAFRIHLRPTFPPTSRAPCGFTAREGSLAAWRGSGIARGPRPYPISGLHLREAAIHEQLRAPRLIGWRFSNV